MMSITELKGRAHAFTMRDGRTFRILARETKKISENNISNEMRIAENMGLIIITADKVVKVLKENKGGTE